jgi:xylulokinase
MTCLLGLDVGTSGAKALLTDAVGRVLATASESYPLHTPRPLWTEQDPEAWWEASATAIRHVLSEGGISPGDVSGVGLTGQMHGLVLLDSRGAVVRPAILWNDQRTAQQCRTITERVGLERLLQLTGNPVLPGFTAPKIAWVAENEPEAFSRSQCVLLPKDYVRYRLTGELRSDVSDASGTSLFDVAHRRWSPEMLDAVGVPAGWMPEVVESAETGGSVSAAGAGATGLLEGTLLAGGAGDQAAGAVGVGAVAPGTGSVSVGTSGVVFAPTGEYHADPEGRLHAFCHAAPGRWHLMGVMLSAAGSLQWYHDLRERRGSGHGPGSAPGSGPGDDSFDLLLEEASRVAPGCEGLLFLPYLTGERTPHADPLARGAFVGLTLRHQMEHMTRAVLEGVGFGLRDSLELIRQSGETPGRARLTGGGARSPIWRQILADILGVALEVPENTEGAAFGAALLGGVASGVFESVDSAVEKTVRVSETVAPGPERSAYEDLYQVYRGLYPSLSSTFEALGQDASGTEL